MHSKQWLFKLFFSEKLHTKKKMGNVMCIIPFTFYLGCVNLCWLKPYLSIFHLSLSWASLVHVVSLYVTRSSLHLCFCLPLLILPCLGRHFSVVLLVVLILNTHARIVLIVGIYSVERTGRETRLARIRTDPKVVFLCSRTPWRALLVFQTWLKKDPLNSSLSSLNPFYALHY